MKQISEALVKAQKQFRPIEKDSINPFFKKNYADLSTILSSVVPILSANGIAISQPMRVDQGNTILCTKLIHESGEFMQSEMILPQQADPQKYGSLITYYKRYQLQAMLGLSTVGEDDDANSIGSYGQQPRMNQAPQQQQSVKPITEGQKKAIYAICQKKGIVNPELKTYEGASKWITENG